MANIPYLSQETAPASEPVTLSEVKAFLRIDNNADDVLIGDLTSSARKVAELYTRRSFITQSWRLSYDDYAPTEVCLPRLPVQSVTSVRTVTRDGTENTIPVSSYYLNAGKEILLFDANPLGHIVNIVYVAGYGSAADVPDDLKQAMLMHISEMYDKRTGEIAVPAHVREIYEKYRIIWV